MSDLIYDIETLPNVFTFSGRWENSDNRVKFEISNRVNQLKELCDFLTIIGLEGHSMVGFNNQGFDYPVLHYIMTHEEHMTVGLIYDKAMKIINTPWENRFSNIVRDCDQLIPQIDLYLIHHFDNPAKMTSLKIIEFNLRMKTIEDLPYPPGTYLTDEQIDVLASYNDHDVDATYDFYNESKDQIKFRRELSEKYKKNVMNFNDTKIGKSYLIDKMEETSPGSCYEGKKKRQTFREIIHFKDVILPGIRFCHPYLQDLHGKMLAKSIVNTKADFKMSVTLRNFQFDFGTGGVHGSIDPCTVVATNTHMIKDIDVKSYYPNLAIKNRFYPEHLSDKFCDIYEEVYDQRQRYSKGTAENALFKLALNGTYGDSNSIYSSLYDPQFTMAITINGQLLLVMLAEALMAHHDVMMIQINTDGMTIKIPRNLEPWVNSVVKWWESMTLLTLESVEYSRFFVRDVNNYIAEHTDGELKRKGVYEYDREWHQNQSALIIQKATEAYFLHGIQPIAFISNHKDVYDFMLRTKVNRTSKLLMIDYHGKETYLQKVTRYYVRYFGGELIKLMPPTASQLKKDPNHPMRRISINKGCRVDSCNDISTVNIDDINFEWYEEEAWKLILPIKKGGIL